MDYNVGTHHTNVDAVGRVREADWRKAAIILSRSHTLRRYTPRSCRGRPLGHRSLGRERCRKLTLMSDAPKSALELVMERLRKKDAEAGLPDTPLTDAQREAIAEARNIYEARVAERRILHQAAVAAIHEPAERDERDVELRRDLERLESERDSKIKRIRETS